MFCANITALNQSTMQKAALLLENGADFTRPDINGQSGFDLVPEPFRLKFFKWVVQNKFSPNRIIHSNITKQFLLDTHKKLSCERSAA